MPKNRIEQIKTQKQAQAEEKARAEAEAQLKGKGPWEVESKDDRISMRIEPSLKKAYAEQLPRHTRISDAIRDHMIRVVQGAEEP